MTNRNLPELLNKDHILAWLDYLHADVQCRLFDHRHGTLHPELGDPVVQFISRFGPEPGIPISFTSRKSQKVSEACVRAWTEYLNAIEAVRLLTQVCFAADDSETKALYEKAFPGVIRAAEKSGVAFGIGQIRDEQGT